MRFTKYPVVAPSLVLAIFAVALIAACGGETTPATGLTAEERLLSWLPAGTTEFAFVDIKTVSSRPDFQDAVDSRFNSLLSVTGEVLNEELLRSAGIKRGAFGFNREEGRDHEVGILEGDFQQLLAALEQAGADGLAEQLEVEVIEVYRDIEIFTISRTSGLPPYPIKVFMGVTDRDKLALAANLESVKKRIDQYLNTGRAPDPFFGGLQSLIEGSTVPFETETYRDVVIYRFQNLPPVYLAVVDQSKLVLGFSVEKIKQIIDRVRDGGEVPQIFWDVFSDLGQADFLYAVPVKQENAASPERPFAAVTFTSWTVFFNEDSTSTVRIRYFFEGPEQAATAAAWIQEQGDLQSGFAGGKSLDVKARQEGRAFLIEAIMPDDEVIGLIVGN